MDEASHLQPLPSFIPWFDITATRLIVYGACMPRCTVCVLVSCVILKEYGTAFKISG